MPIRKAWLSLYRFSKKLTIAQQHYVQLSYTTFHPNETINFGSRFIYTAKVWLAVHRFLTELANTQHAFVAILHRDFYGNQTEIQEAGQYYTYLCPQGKCGFYRTNFYRTPSAQQHYEEIFDTKFNPKRSRNIEGMGQNFIYTFQVK